MSDLSSRLARLSPAKREILLRRLAEQGAAVAKVPPGSALVRRPPGEPTPLSFAQERMWFLERLQPGFYNNLDALRLDGPLDAPRLVRAFQALVERHDVLASAYPEHDGIPRVEPAERRPFLARLDLGTPELDPGADTEYRRLRRLATALARRPLDLARGPLARALLVRLHPRVGAGRAVPAPTDRHVLLVVFHHSVVDAWSDGLLFRDLATFYRRLGEGPSEPGAELPELPMRYGDWAAWQREHLNDERLARAIEGWRLRLGETLTPAELPRDRSLAESRTLPDGISAGRWPIEWPVELRAGLEARGREQGATLFMTVLALLQLLLHRLSGAPRIQVGTPVANRRQPEIQDVVGLFLDTLVLSTEVAAAPRLGDLVADARRVVTDALAHQDLPFERLVEALEPERDPDRTPLFQVLYTLENHPGPGVSFPGVEVESLSLEVPRARFEISLWLSGRGAGLVGWLEVDRRRWDLTTAGRMSHQLRRLAEALVADPNQDPATVPLLDRAQRHQILGEWNDTAIDTAVDIAIDRVAVPGTEAHRTLHDLVAARRGGPARVTDGRETLDLATLLDRAQHLAAHLAASGLGRGDRVGLCLERGVELPVALLAILQSGAAYVPLDPGFPPKRLAMVVEDADLAAIVTRGELVDLLPGTEVEKVLLEEVPPHPSPLPRPSLGPDDLAYAIFTSGSTGRPKGVEISHGAAVNFLHAMASRLGLGPGDTLVAVTTLSFDIALLELFLPLVVGARVWVASREQAADGVALRHLLEASEATALQATPATWQMLLDAGYRPPAGLKVLCGGEALAHDLARRLTHDGATLWNLYGPTETTVWSSVERLRPKLEPPRIGRPIDQTQMVVMDRRFRPSPLGVAGELLIGGQGLARGYVGRPATSAERFVPNPFSTTPGARLYRTGDLARQLADGRFDHLGRLDHQVKIRGFRIELGEVESALLRQPGVARAVALAQGEGGERRLVAWVVPTEGTILDPAVLRRALADELPGYMVPGSLMALDSLPLTPNGKVDRKALPAPETLESDGSATAPRNLLEEWVAGVWAELLDRDRVGLDDDLFALGAHSLLGVRFMARARQAFGVEPPLTELFRHPTVADLAALLGSLRRSGAHTPVLCPAAAERGLPFPMTELQQAYWIGARDTFELGQISAHIYREVDVEGLDVAALERAFRRLIERHDLLRARILDEGQLQVFEPETLDGFAQWKVGVDDWRGEDPTRVETRLDTLRRRLGEEGPDLDTWPLFELRVTIRDNAEKAGVKGESSPIHRIHFSISLVICDAWSSRLLTRELLELLARDGVATPGADPLPPLELGFRDVVVAQREHRRGDAHGTALAYWDARLPELPAAPELPLARDPSTVERPVFRRREGRLEADAWERLKRRARSLGVTPTAALAAAYGEVLATWSKGSHFLLNTLFGDRPPWHPQIERLVGNFSSTLLLEVDARQPASFAERASALQRRLWSDLDHTSVTGVEVLRRRARLDGGRARPAMPVVFSSTLGFGGSADDPVPPWARGARVVHRSLQTPQIWLDHQVGEVEGALAYTWDVVEELFPAGLMDDLWHAYGELLDALGGADEAVWRAPTRDLVPRRQLTVREMQNTWPGTPPSGLLHLEFFSRARDSPRQPAVITEGRTLSYGELSARALSLAEILRRRGVVPNTRVAVVMEKGWEQLAAVLAIHVAGGAYLPIDPVLPGERLRFLLRNSSVEQVLTQSWVEPGIEWPQGIERHTVDRSPFDADLSRHGPPPLGTPVQKPTDLAYIIYTSGSTGLPKGVMIDHRGALNTVVDVNQRLCLGPDDRVLALSSMSFDLSVWDVFGLLSAGGAVVLPAVDATREPARWAALARQTRVTVWNSVPALVEMMADHLESSDEPLPESLRAVMMSGDWIPLPLPGRLRALAAPESLDLYSLGGATEASIWSIWHAIDALGPSWTSIPYGRPMRHQAFHVLDEALEPCPDWVPGQLFIGGVGVALGYWRDTERTTASFITDPRTGERLYRTGDLGRFRPDGTIEFLGREDAQVKVQGYRIELGEIEAALLEHPALLAAVVVARGEARGPRQLVGYLVPQPGESPGHDALRAFLGEKLPPYMVPPIFVTLDALPLSANGKVDRKALPDPERGGGGGRLAPRDTVELELARLFTELLEAEVSSVDDDFFSLGGHSLLAVRLMARIEQRFGRRLAISSLFEHGSVAALAALLRAEERPSQGPLVAIQSRGEDSPLVFVHPVGGSVVCYGALARVLGNDRPFWGLAREDDDPTSVPELAARYLETLEDGLPPGPVHLGGWSMGGVVAYEMARQLRARGDSASHRVAGLILIDSDRPEDERALADGPEATGSPDDAILAAWFLRDLTALVGRRDDLDPELLRPLDENARLDLLFERAQTVAAIPPDLDRITFERYYRRFYSNHRALLAYRPEPWDGTLIELRAADGVGETAEGWRELARTATIETLAGDHYSLVHPPAVETLAQRLSRHLLASEEASLA